MSGSPKYSSVSYSLERQRVLAREREKRERTRKALMEEQHRRAQAAARGQAARTAGMLAQLDSQLAYLRRGVDFTPTLADELQAPAAQIEVARSLFQRGRLTEAQAIGARLTPIFDSIRERMETHAEQLALRLATLDALSAGLSARGYDVGEALAQPDGTIALRANLGGQAGLDVAVVAGQAGDEVAWQRHNAEGPQSASAVCESVHELHSSLRAELANTGIELGDLRWSEPGAEVQEPRNAHIGRESAR
jgi:hypothetical protein